MNASTSNDCLVCRKHAGKIPVAGGFIYENNLIYIYLAQLYGAEQDHYLGHVFIETRRHVAELAGQEAQCVGLYTSRVARALLETQGMDHIYTIVLGDGVPHVHVHVIGRYPGAPRTYWGPRVDEWPEAPGAEPSKSSKWPCTCAHSWPNTTVRSKEPG